MKQVAVSGEFHNETNLLASCAAGNHAQYILMLANTLHKINLIQEFIFLVCSCTACDW